VCSLPESEQELNEYILRSFLCFSRRHAVANKKSIDPFPVCGVKVDDPSSQVIRLHCAGTNQLIWQIPTLFRRHAAYHYVVQ